MGLIVSTLRSAEAKRQAEALALQAKKDQRAEATRKKLAEAKSVRQLKKQEAFSETQAKHRARHEELEVARKQLGEAIKGKNQHTEQVRTPTDRLRIRPPDPTKSFAAACRSGARIPHVCSGAGCSGWRSVGR